MRDAIRWVLANVALSILLSGIVGIVLSVRACNADDAERREIIERDYDLAVISIWGENNDQWANDQLMRMYKDGWVFHEVQSRTRIVLKRRKGAK